MEMNDFDWGKSIDDNVKQKLLDSLAEEPTMVISTAYAYAKNYVNYGVDITKAWTTAAQQASILDYVRTKAIAEAYDSFKKEYESRLKTDLEQLDSEIQEQIAFMGDGEETSGMKRADNLVKDKINALKQSIWQDNYNGKKETNNG